MRKLPTTISEQQFLEGLKTVNKPKKRLAYMLGFYQCLRVSEVVNLVPSDVDRDRGYLYIRAAKGNKDRHVPIMAPVRRGLMYLPVGVGVRALQMSIKKVWPELHFHSLRHSGATYYLNNKKVDVRFLQQLLGHSRLDTTTIYTHVTPENLKKVFEEVWG